MSKIGNVINERFLLQKEYLGTEKPVNKISPLVSVTVATYQHYNYIKECLNGILMQKVNFAYEIIIGEDASTDGTQEICKEYAEKYPDKIRLFIRNRELSQYYDSNGTFVMRFNGIWNRMSARGKYIAWCEGDDYWTDPLKLQKQVDFLEINPEYSFCFHNAIIFYEDKGTSNIFDKRLKTKEYNTNDLLFKDWFIPTASLVICKDKLPQPYPEWYFKIYNGDFGLELLLSTKGNFFCINEIMSVYRKNTTGSLTLIGLKGTDYLYKFLFLLQNFKQYNQGKNVIANNYRIFTTRYALFKQILLKYKMFQWIRLIIRKMKKP
ncbi:MAG: glycosyltransferase [Bacteroidales bacterium]|jgi:glycosyltransferase involved in cell wall biosynthesis|nr:glycosyltransferase [Bacteroidales bacterium]